MPPPITETMLTILVEAQTLARAVETDPDLRAADRETLLSALAKITAQAELVLEWAGESSAGELSV
ncbi:MAG TPA: hypothetical protein VF698_04815 [Thermoanaerobaculia bacterium]|jgi:hypothetical protein